MLSVRTGVNGALRAVPAGDRETATFAGDLPASACPPDLTGRWRHFKGGEYRFLALVERPPDDPLVLYEDANGGFWLRPHAMIDEVVERDGCRQARFVRLAD